MRATKCDRCGYVFTLPEVMNNISYKDEYWRLSIHRDNHPYPEETLDLCPDCQKELLTWLKMDN